MAFGAREVALIAAILGAGVLPFFGARAKLGVSRAV
jgi:hypothetical protein